MEHQQMHCSPSLRRTSFETTPSAQRIAVLSARSCVEERPGRAGWRTLAESVDARGLGDARTSVQSPHSLKALKTKSLCIQDPHREGKRDDCSEVRTRKQKPLQTSPSKIMPSRFKSLKLDTVPEVPTNLATRRSRLLDMPDGGLRFKQNNWWATLQICAVIAYPASLASVLVAVTQLITGERLAETRGYDPGSQIHSWACFSMQLVLSAIAGTIITLILKVNTRDQESICCFRRHPILLAFVAGASLAFVTLIESQLHRAWAMRLLLGTVVIIGTIALILNVIMLFFHWHDLLLWGRELLNVLKSVIWHTTWRSSGMNLSPEEDGYLLYSPYAQPETHTREFFSS